MAKRKSTRVYIDDILTSISRIEAYLSGIDKATMIEDYRITDGIERNIEKVSEGSRKGIP